MLDTMGTWHIRHKMMMGTQPDSLHVRLWPVRQHLPCPALIRTFFVTHDREKFTDSVTSVKERQPRVHQFRRRSNCPGLESWVHGWAYLCMLLPTHPPTPYCCAHLCKRQPIFAMPTSRGVYSITYCPCLHTNIYYIPSTG